jgi:hypothetical protein
MDDETPKLDIFDLTPPKGPFLFTPRFAEAYCNTNWELLMLFDWFSLPDPECPTRKVIKDDRAGEAI